MIKHKKNGLRVSITDNIGSIAIKRTGGVKDIIQATLIVDGVEHPLKLTQNYDGGVFGYGINGYKHAEIRTKVKNHSDKTKIVVNRRVLAKRRAKEYEQQKFITDFSGVETYSKGAD